MKYRFLILIFITIFTSKSFSQNFELVGKMRPGEVLIGFADSLKSVFLDNDSLEFNKGVFLFGFDRDDKGIHKLKLNFLNGKDIVKILKLKNRKYKIQRINKIKKKYVSPPKTALNRIAKERRKLRKARKEIGKDKTPYFLSGFIKPVKSNRITSVFGSQRILNGIPKNPHNGLDIAAPLGTPVYAAASGIVRFTGKNFYYNGNFILLDHGQGLNSIYLHLSKILVKTGNRVQKGQKIGEIGTTGRSTGPHLHWGVQWFSKRIDPESLLHLNISKLRAHIKTIYSNH